MTRHRTSVHFLPTYEVPEPWTAGGQRPVTRTARPSRRSTEVDPVPTYELPEIDPPRTAKCHRQVATTVRPSKLSTEQPGQSRAAAAPARGRVASHILYLLWALAAVLFLTRIALGASLETIEPWSEASIDALRSSLRHGG